MKIDIYSLKFKIFMLVIFLIYFAFLLRLAVFRDGFSVDKIWQVGKYNLVPFLDYANVWQNGGIKSFLRLFFGNLGWFFPLGFFARYKFTLTKTAKIVLFGFLFSLLVEILQFVFKTGIFELDDLILNSIGVFLGAKFCEILLKLNKNNYPID
ncbi:VanZ family protein [Campylobacter sp. CN_NA1]|uniref:VanZ family protein n=2 Tax=Campylobacter TaxID=194 RepID=UPI0022E9EC1C|nr:VanZ family protein [Campylobacter sp. CN_NA1]